MSKLSRKKKIKQQAVLENSFDDFQEEKKDENMNKSQQSSATISINKENKKDKDTNEELEVDTVGTEQNNQTEHLPNCPFCHKEFQSSHVSQRSSHLKSCARTMKISTTKLLEVMQLERRQKEERRALGLLTPPPKSALQVTKTRKNNSTNTAANRRKKKVSESEGVDPDLALALALSISSATSATNNHNEAETVTDQTSEQVTCKQNSIVNEATEIDDAFKREQDNIIAGNVEDENKEAPNSCFSYSPTKSIEMADSSKAAKMWLPQAPTEPVKKKSKKTGLSQVRILETRSKLDRDRLIEERMGFVLFPDNLFGDLDHLERSWDGLRISSSNILPLQQNKFSIWNMTSKSDQCTPGKFISQELEEYIGKVQTTETNAKQQEITKTNNLNNSTTRPPLIDRPKVHSTENQSLCNLSSDMIKLLKSAQIKSNGTIKVLCKGEKPVFCHEFLLQIRSPILLQDMIVEHNETGSEKYIVMSNYDKIVVQVLMEFLYAGVFNVDKLEDLAQFAALKQLAKQLNLKELSTNLKNIEVTEEECEDNEANYSNLELDESAEKSDIVEVSNHNNSDALNELVEAFSQDYSDDNIDKESEGEKIEFDDEWESFCEVFTQKQRSNTLTSQNSCSSLHELPEKDDDSDDDVLDNQDQEIDHVVRHHSYNDDGCLAAQDEVIDLTQEKELSSPIKDVRSDERDLSSPDIFADSDPEMESSAISRQRSVIKSGKSDYSLPSPVPLTPSSISSKPNFDYSWREKSDVLGLNTSHTSPRHQDDHSFGNQFETPNKNNFSPHALSCTKNDLSSPESVKSNKLNSDTPKATCVEKSVSRKRILSSQNSQNPRSTKKQRSFSEESTVQILFRLQQDLNCPNQDQEDILQQLLQTELTVDHLLATGIGKDVNRLKNKSGVVGSLTRKLIKKWHKLINLYTLGQKDCDGNSETQGCDAKNDIDDDNEKQIDKEALEVTNNHEVGNVAQSSSKESDYFEDIEFEKIENNKTENDKIDVANSSCKEYEYFDDFEFENMNDFEAFDVTEKSSSKRCDEIKQDSIINDNHDDMVKSTKVVDRHDEGIPDFLNTPPPVNKHLLIPSTPKCTPLPDYENYLSPELRAELKKFGLKAVPKKKAILFLQHIYDETHPWVTNNGSVVKRTPIIHKNKKVTRNKVKGISKLALDTKTDSPKKKIDKSDSKEKKKQKAGKVNAKNASKVNAKITSKVNIKNTSKGNAKLTKESAKNKQDEVIESNNVVNIDAVENIYDDDDVTSFGSQSQCSQDSRLSDDENDVPEETFLGLPEDEELLSQVPCESTLFEQLDNFIKSRPCLHQDVLLYRPIWLNQFIRDVKEAGIKCKQDQIVDFFDKMCITFRFENRNNKPENKKSPRKSPKKVNKKSPKKKGQSSKQ